MKKLPTLTEYYDLLDKHDWYHEFSDDLTHWERGRANYRHLLEVAYLGGFEYDRLFAAFQAHYFSGRPFPGEQKPKPAKL